MVSLPATPIVLVSEQDEKLDTLFTVKMMMNGKECPSLR